MQIIFRKNKGQLKWSGQRINFLNKYSFMQRHKCSNTEEHENITFSYMLAKLCDISDISTSEVPLAFKAFTVKGILFKN